MADIDALLDHPELPCGIDWGRVKNRRDVVLVAIAAMAATQAFHTHCMTLASMAPLVDGQGVEGWKANIRWLREQITEEAPQPQAPADNPPTWSRHTPGRSGDGPPIGQVPSGALWSRYG